MRLSLRSHIVVSSIAGAWIGFIACLLAYEYSLYASLAFLAATALVWCMAMLMARRPLAIIDRLNRWAGRLLADDWRERTTGLDSGDIRLDQLGSYIIALARKLRKMQDESDRLVEESRSVLDDLADAVIVVDSGARVTRVNPAAGVFFGQIPHGLMIGQTVLEATLNHTFDQMVRQCLDNKTVVDDFLDIHSPRERATSVAIIPKQGRGGDIEGAVAVLHDISEIREADRMRKDFVANASHELRTPIASVRVMADSLINGALQDPDLGMKFAKSIADSAERLGHLVDDLLFLNIQESGHEVIKTRVDLSEVAAEVTEKLSPRALERDIKLTNSSSESQFVFGDEQDLWRVVVNLVENAIRYTDPGGRIEVRVFSEDGNAVLTVRDSGIGIAREEQDKIFERFYRVDIARSREMGGTGLGLSIVKNTVQRAGGHVEVESEPGRGSLFRIVLPKADDKDR